MRKFWFPWALLLAVGGLSCSKTHSGSIPPTPGPVVIELGPTDTPTPVLLEQTEEAGPPEYVMEDLKGTVLIREAGSRETSLAEEEEVVGEGDEVITKDGSEATLTLDENTMFHLSPGSDIKVDELKPNLSGGFLSRLGLLRGKVLSEVEKLTDNQSAFDVESGGVVCAVRGTAFEVQNQDGAVQTLTFHGEVEMRKGALVQPVVAGHHAAFLLRKGVFQPARLLTGTESRRYQTWLQKRPRVLRKQARRLAALRAYSNLSPGEKKRVQESLRNVPRKDRLRKMRRILRTTAPARPFRGVSPALRQKGRLLRQPRRPLQPFKGQQPNRPGVSRVQHPLARPLKPGAPGNRNQRPLRNFQRAPNHQAQPLRARPAVRLRVLPQNRQQPKGRPFQRPAPKGGQKKNQKEKDKKKEGR